MAEREKLPSRRRTVTLEFDHVTTWGPGNLPASRVPYVASLGYYDDGRLGEVFIESAQKVATGTDIAVRDAAISLSVALQYGADVKALVTSFLHDSQGRPEGVLGQLIQQVQQRGLLKIPPFGGLRGAER